MDENRSQTWLVMGERFALALIGIGCVLVIVSVVWWVSRPPTTTVPGASTSTTVVSVKPVVTAGP